MRLMSEAWPHLLAATIPLVQAIAAVHVILRKRNVRAAVGWMGLIWLAPVVGVVLHITLGVNRIQRKAGSLRGHRKGYEEWIPSEPVGEERASVTPRVR